jgi:tetratricopeptide (TPR) repeat protein
MALPLDLVPYYPYPREASLLDLEYGMGLLLAVGITAACAAAAKKRKVWLSAWGCYAVMLLPVLGIVQVGHQAMAERYTYLPSIGPFLVAGLGAAWIAQKAGTGPRRVIPATLVVAVFLALSYGTVQQIGVWKNGFVLWDSVIAKGIESATAYNNRGLSLEAMGEREKAMADYTRAVALEPWDSYAYNNLGVLHGKDGLYGRSIEYFLKAIALNPKHADPYCNLGLSYFNIQQYDKALENYSKAIDLKRDFDAAYLNRGNLFLITGNRARALADYRKACGLGNGRACEVLNLVSGK